MRTKPVEEIDYNNSEEKKENRNDTWTLNIGWEFDSLKLLSTNFWLKLKKIHIIFVIKIYIGIILSKIRRKFKSEEICAENIENTYFQLSSPLHKKWKKIMLVTRVVAI